MTKEQFFKKYVQPKTVVHCKTEELANELLAKAHEYGLRWSDGSSYLKNNHWIDEEENTCYRLSAGKLNNIISYQVRSYTIIEFNGFEKETAEHMFEKLGFARKADDYHIIFNHKEFDIEIRFSLDERVYFVNTNERYFAIIVDVHKAITKQIEELGWDKEVKE